MLILTNLGFAKFKLRGFDDSEPEGVCVSSGSFYFIRIL